MKPIIDYCKCVKTDGEQFHDYTRQVCVDCGKIPYDCVMESLNCDEATKRQSIRDLRSKIMLNI